jgi:2',3'-cyclic-nucleotide 2'-phosphodiesterase (5'-nucleotidase family)
MPDPIKVTILHTNDMHGRLKPMSRLSTYASKLKVDLRAQGHHVFFMDAGDAADRRLGFCGVTKGEAFIPLLNAMRYDVQALGNALSLTYGPRAISAYAERAEFPVLAANVHNADGKLLPGLSDQVLFSLENGRKLGVIGLTVADFAFIYDLFGLTLLDMVPLVRVKADALCEAGADVVVMLSHIGIKKDRELAAALPELDVIIGGHSHTTLPHGEEINGVLIAQTGQYAEYLGRVDLTLDADTGRVLARSAELLKIPKDMDVDPAVQAAIAAAEVEAQTYRSRPLGELLTAFEMDHFAECSMGNWAADVLRERMGAEVGMVSSGLLHDGLDAGVVTLGALDAACFTTANPQLSLVRGVQLRDALERGLDPERSHNYYSSNRGTPVGLPQISGLQVGFDDEAPAGERVKLVLVNHQILEEDREYRVAHTDAEASPESGYLQIDPSQTIKTEVPTILREALEDDLKRRSPLPLPEKGRWF